MTSGPREVRLATLRSGVPLTIEHARPDGALLVRVSGGIEVAGLVPLDALGVLVCEAGLIDGHWYAGHGNLLRLRSSVSAGRVRVAGQVHLRERAYERGVPFARRFRRIAVEGEIEGRRLCAAVPPKKHAGTAEDPTIMRVVGEVHEDDFPAGTTFVTVDKDVAITLLDRPGGTPVFTRPADRWGYTLARLRREGDWDQVAAGSGPYLVGWIPKRPERKLANVFGVGGLGLRGTAIGPQVLRTKELQRLPLHSLPAGTELQHFGRVQARLTKPGFARVSTQRDGWCYVVATVDDDVVVEGWINPRQLGPLVEQGTP